MGAADIHGRWAAYKLLQRMATAGEIKRLDHGKYGLPFQVLSNQSKCPTGEKAAKMRAKNSDQDNWTIWTPVSRSLRRYTQASRRRCRNFRPSWTVRKMTSPPTMIWRASKGLDDLAARAQLHRLRPRRPMELGGARFGCSVN